MPTAKESIQARKTKNSLKKIHDALCNNNTADEVKELIDGHISSKCTLNVSHNNITLLDAAINKVLSSQGSEKYKPLEIAIYLIQNGAQLYQSTTPSLGCDKSFEECYKEFFLLIIQLNNDNQKFVDIKVLDAFVDDIRNEEFSPEIKPLFDQAQDEYNSKNSPSTALLPHNGDIKVTSLQEGEVQQGVGCN